MRHAISATALLLTSIGCATAEPRAFAAADGDGVGERVSLGFMQSSEVANAPAASPIAAANKKAALDAPRPDADAVKRQVVYSADLSLVAFDVSATLAQVRSLAEKAGGYMSAMEADSITVRVPATKFQPLLDAAERLGEVVNKSIKANDVTEELVDLGLRLDNAEKTRGRLLELLPKAEKMEDTLKIEAEVSRLTGEIERMKGRQRFLNDQVAMSSVRVAVNSPRPRGQRTIEQQIPFAWMRSLAADALSGNAAAVPQRGNIFNRGARFDLPGGFIRYFDTNELTQAMNADGVFIKLQKVDNFDKGDLRFWAPLSRRVLVEERSLAVDAERDETLPGNVAAKVFSAKRDLGGKAIVYTLAIAPRDKAIYVFEAWGPAVAYETQKAAIERAIKTLKTGW